MLKKLSALFAVSALVLVACTPQTLTAQGFSPAAAATAVPVDTTVSATFNIAPLSSSVVNALTVTSGSPAVAVAGSVTYDSGTRTITFTPSAPLSHATTYTATLGANIRTSDGTRISGQRSWSFTTEDAPAASVVSVTIDQGDLSLIAGTTSSLTATVAVINGADQAVTWSSDDEAVATVSVTGVVSALTPGTATVTATSVADPSKHDSIIVSVALAPDVTDVSIVGGDRVVLLSDAVTFTATVAAEGGADDTVKWSSSDTTVADIDPATGAATLVAAGTTTITAASNFDDTVTDSVTLTVAGPLSFTGDYAAFTGTANVQSSIDLVSPALTGGYGTIVYTLAAGSTLPDDFIVDDGVAPVTYDVTLDGATGAISGETGYPGTYTGSVIATDQLGQTATADYSLTLGLDFTYVAEDLVTPATEFVYDPAAVTPEYVIPGIQVHISGVPNTDWLPSDLSDDLRFSFTVVSATDILGDPIAAPDSTGVTLNTLEGTFYRTAAITDADWLFDVTLTDEATSESSTVQVAWLNSDWLVVP